MSASVSTATPHRPTSPSAIGSSESMPEQRRHVERGRQPVAARPDDLLEPPVGVVGRAEAGEHPHRPQLRAVHRRVRPAGVRVLRPGTRRRRARRPARPGSPTSSRSRHPDAAPHRTPPATHHVDSSGMGSPPPVYGRHGNERLRCVPLRGRDPRAEPRPLRAIHAAWPAPPRIRCGRGCRPAGSR